MTQPETQPVWVTILSLLVGGLALLGVCSIFGAVNDWNNQQLLYGENTIVANITVEQVVMAHGYPNGVVDTDGKGYVLNSIFSFSRMDTPIAGHNYSIKYFCNPLENNNRDVMEMIDLAQNQYVCVTTDGVCK